MAYTDAEARQQILDAVAEAIDAIGVALASLAEAHERLDDDTADTLERELFRPVQLAYGRAQRTSAAFANRYQLPVRAVEPAPQPAPSHSTKDLLNDAAEAIAEADNTLATLQDSMLPVEVGDVELRAGLEEVRTLIGAAPGQAREIVRTLGR